MHGCIKLLIIICRILAPTAFFLTTILSFSHGQSSPYRHYTVDDGLSSNTVYEMVQDDLGFIWLATSNGVCRFDGRIFTNYFIREGLSDNDILRIFKDRKGRLWLSGFNGTVTIIENNKILNSDKLPLLSKLNSDFFYVSFYETRPGEIVLGNHQNSFARIRLPGQLEMEKSKKEIIFKTQKGYIDLNEEFNVKPENNGDTIFINWKTNPVFSYFNFADSLLFLNTSRGLIALDKNHHSRMIDIPQGVLTSSSKVFCDQNLGLWISSNNGITYLKPHRSKYEVFRKYFQDYNVTSVFNDREQNIWIGTHGNGVFMLPANFESVTSYTTGDGLWNSESYAVLKDSEEQLWVGHGNAMLDLIAGKSIRSIRLHNESFTISRTVNIKQHPNGTIIAGTDMGLFYLVKDNHGGYLVKRQFFWNNRKLEYKLHKKGIKDLKIDAAGNLMAVSMDGIHRISAKDMLKNDVVAHYENLPVKRYYAVCPIDSTDYWFADADGLKRSHNGVVTDFSAKHPLLSKRISDISEFGNDLFVTVEGYGLLIISDGKKLMHFNIENGLSSNNCYGIHANDSMAFVCTDNGIQVFQKDVQGKYLLSNITVHDGLLSNYVNDVFASGGEVYAATQRGISVINLHSLDRKKITPPEIHLIHIKWNGNEIPATTSGLARFGDGNLKFTFVSPYFGFPEGIKYQYSIYDGIWISIPSGEVEFNALQPGKYTLRVKAIFPGSTQQSVSDFAFVIPQPFYSAWWFYLLAAVIAIASTLFLFKRKSTRLKREQQSKLEYEQRINKLQTQSLQAMMNPHFIFNSLNAIQQLINSNQNRSAGNYLTRFARLMRLNLETINEEFISLKDELERIDLYMSTEKLRLGNKLHFEIKMEPALKNQDLYLPSMIIQPFLENSIWHGIMPKAQGGTIILEVIRETHSLIIVVDDDGIGFDETKIPEEKGATKTHLGINLIRKRLDLIRLKTGKNYDLTIRKKIPAEGPGTIVNIRIPQD